MWETDQFVPVISFPVELPPIVNPTLEPDGVADNVVKAPVFGVVLPIVPGAAHVLPSSCVASITPVLEYVSVAPEPTVIVAEVFVPVAIAPKAGVPEETVVQVGSEDAP